MELLVVMALLAGLGLLVAGGFGGHTSTQLRSAERLLGSLVQSARAQASLQQTRARLLCYADDAEPERRGRWLGLVYEDPAQPGQWIADGSGISLPGFVRLYQAPGSLEMRLPFPLAAATAEGQGSSWSYLEFGADGFLTSAQATPLVLGIPALLDGPSGPLADWDSVLANAAVGGLIVKPGGGLLTPENADQLVALLSESDLP